MKDDKQLQAIYKMLVDSQRIPDEEFRIETIRMIWATLLFYLDGSFRKISPEEKLIRKALKV